jgi:hypothetical protein
MHKLPNLASCSFDSREGVLSNFCEDVAWHSGMPSAENGKQHVLQITIH